MIGEVKIYKTYNNSEELIHSENNMIVDGMKEYFADVMSYFPSPSALSGDLSAYYAASAFGIKAWSLGPQRGRFLNENAWDGVSGYTTNFTTPSSPSSVLSSLDETTGHHLLPYPANNKLIGTNFKDNYYYNTGSPTSALLYNHNFSSISNKLRNPGFAGPKLDLSLSGSVFNEILGLYEVPYWDTSSTLRYFVSSAEFSSNGNYGSIAVVPASSNAFSSTEASSSNLLHIRSFATSANPDTSGAVHIKQTTLIPKSDFSPFVEEDALLNPIGVLEYQHFDTSANHSTQTIVTLKDESTGEVYDFNSCTWSSTNSISYAFDGSWNLATSSPKLSSFIFNLPSGKLSNKLSLTLSFYASATDDVYETYITEPTLGFMEGWKYGTLVSGDYVSRGEVSGGLQVFKNGHGGTPDPDDWDTQTMLVQSFSGIYPNRAYYQRADVSATNTQPYEIRTSLIASDNILNSYKYDAAQQLNFSSFILETSTGKVMSPLSRAWSKESYPVSHACVAIDNLSSISASGTFSLGKNYKLGIQTWDAYDSTISPCNIENSPNVGHLNAFFKVSKSPLKDLYWDSVSNEWNDTSSYVSLSGTKTGFNKKSKLLRMTPLLQNYCDEDNNLTMTVTLSATEGDAFFKEFELIGSRLNLSSTAFVAAHQAATSVFNGWDIVSNSSLSSNLSSLPYEKTIVDNVDNTAIGYDKTNLTNFFVYYEDLMRNESFTPRKDNEFKYVFRITDGPTTPAMNKILNINSIGLGDAGTIFLSSNSYTGDKVTSERYEGSYYTFYEDNTFRVTFGKGIGAGNQVRRTALVPAIPFNTSSFSLSGAVGYNYSPLNAFASNDEFGQKTKLEYTHCLSTLNMSQGDTVRAVFEYNSVDEVSSGTYAGASSFMYGAVMAEVSPGEVYSYNYTDSVWERVHDAESQIMTGDFQYNFTQARRGFDAATSGNFKTVKSPAVSLAYSLFSEKTKLKWTIYSRAEWESLGGMYRNPFAITNIRFYKESDKSLSGYPEFPNPVDKTLQNPYPLEPHSEFGHFPNYQAEFAWSGLSATNTVEQLVMAGSYVPVSGITVSSTTYTTGFNTYSAVNSEGYIYESSGITKDWMGFTKKAVTTDNSGLLYTLSVSSGEVNYLMNVKGGIGSAGMWVLDHSATYKKLKDLGDSITGLYNITEVKNNPVFRLAAKKVFNIGGLRLNGSDTGIRIKWLLRFL